MVLFSTLLACIIFLITLVLVIWQPKNLSHWLVCLRAEQSLLYLLVWSMWKMSWDVTTNRSGTPRLLLWQSF